MVAAWKGDRLGNLGFRHELRAHEQALKLGAVAGLREGGRHVGGAHGSREHERLCETSHGDSPIPRHPMAPGDSQRIEKTLANAEGVLR